MSLPFLLEIGTEEIPDWMIPGALQNLEGLFLARTGFHATHTDATPRRLVLYAAELPEREPDTEEWISGPPKDAPAPAVQGFARKQGVSVQQLTLRHTSKGEYHSYLKKKPGRETKAILAEALPEIILNINFPKTMYWTGKSGPRFVRPIRWMIALLGDEVIPFEVGGVRAGNCTSGHRQLGAAQILVSIKSYEQALRENFVIVRAEERRRKIEWEIGALGVKVKSDSELLTTLVYMTEFPTPILGNFDVEFLSLPDEVLTTVMRHHQKYFSVEGESGRLAPQFVAVMNTNSDPEGLVRRGNERVLRARFNDARFFWQTDQRKKLAERIGDLAHITFQARLGSYLDKTRCVVNLVKQLGGNEFALRAAELAKCDLTTELVKEFPELQGAVGGLYAREQGEPEEVWQGIYDHYKPVSMEDSIPRSRSGQLVALADKLDTLRSCFRIGLIPTGSRDPFALRRAAQGVVKIIVEGKLQLDLGELLNGNPQLEEFLLDRARYYFKDIRGFRYDEVNAVLASRWHDLVDVESRLQAIQAVRPTENFEPLAASFKRIKNILKQAEPYSKIVVDPSLLETGPESELYAEFQRVRDGARAMDYKPALEAIASLRPKVDRFFDKVLVNAPDSRIRQNRLALLHNLLAEFSTIADFSELVTNS